MNEGGIGLQDGTPSTVRETNVVQSVKRICSLTDFAQIAAVMPFHCHPQATGKAGSVCSCVCVRIHVHVRADEARPAVKHGGRRIRSHGAHRLRILPAGEVLRHGGKCLGTCVLSDDSYVLEQ